LFTNYFEHWYSQFDTDEKQVLSMLRATPDFDLKLRRAASAYRLIDDQDQMAVVVPYVPHAGPDDRVAGAQAALQFGKAERWHLRALQRFVVQARQRSLREGLARGDLTEPLPGWCVLNDDARYSARFGLLADGVVLDAASLVQ
jgi:hypothetical protein